MVKLCKNCGRENKDYFNFCVYCGNQLPKHLICPDCKKEYLEIDYVYCYKCGAKLLPYDSFNETAIDIDLDNLSQSEICEIFWKEFNKELNKTNNKFSPLCQVKNRPRNCFSMEGIDHRQAHLTTLFYFGRYRNRIEIKIFIDKNKPLFLHLLKRKDYYNKKFPHDLIWLEKGIACNIALRLDLSICEISDWDEIIHQYINQMNKFCEVFSEDINKFS